MAVGFTTQDATAILASRIRPTTYIALSTTIPNKDGSNFSEPEEKTDLGEETGYRRAPFGKINATKDSQIANDEIIFICEALVNLGKFKSLGLSDSDEVGGRVFLMADLDPEVTVGAGYVPLIRRNKLVIGLDVEELEAYA